MFKNGKVTNKMFEQNGCSNKVLMIKRGLIDELKEGTLTSKATCTLYMCQHKFWNHFSQQYSPLL